MTGTFCISAATANVRTLATGPNGYKGKIAYLQAQFQTHHLNFVGLQETRTKEGLIRNRGGQYARFCSGDDGGHHGVELWLSTTQPIGYIADEAIYADPSKVVILHRDPRRLLARIETELEPLYVGVLHGPQSGINEAERETWWKDTLGSSYFVTQTQLVVQRILTLYLSTTMTSRPILSSSLEPFRVLISASPLQETSTLVTTQPGPPLTCGLSGESTISASLRVWPTRSSIRRC